MKKLIKNDTYLQNLKLKLKKVTKNIKLAKDCEKKWPNSSSMSMSTVLILVLGPHLFFRDGHSVFEDDPLHGLAAGRRGQRAVVNEVLLCGVGQ